MDESLLEIPRRLADPPKMFFWDIDVVAVFSICFLMGAMLNMFGSSMILGAVLALSYSKMKSGKHPAYAVHLMYWYMSSTLFSMNRVPHSHIREMLG
jgi:conjugal transfer pilus assembly protein TraL